MRRLSLFLRHPLPPSTPSPPRPPPLVPPALPPALPSPLLLSLSFLPPHPLRPASLRLSPIALPTFLHSLFLSRSCALAEHERAIARARARACMRVCARVCAVARCFSPTTRLPLFLPLLSPLLFPPPKEGDGRHVITPRYREFLRRVSSRRDATRRSAAAVAANKSAITGNPIGPYGGSETQYPADT